ncbi:MAG: hypothetical protein IT458_09680 [Planctomycetes bacterium]|nr:hypothetical protein [Planctomycetota bacterium]
MSVPRSLPLLLLLAGCQGSPVDPFAAAEAELADGAFLQTLIRLDRVPPAHPRYAEARALAQALQRRVRVGQELVLRGLVLRSEWRDEEAIAMFERAREVWPDVQGARELVEATQSRLATLREGRWQGGEMTTVAVESPLGAEGTEPAPEAPPTPGGAATSRPSGAPGSDEFRVVEERLRAGDLEGAIDALQAASRTAQQQPRHRELLVQVLHQRGLLHYGQAFLEDAIEDWKRVLEVQPGHAAAEPFLKAAEAELKVRRP